MAVIFYILQTIAGFILFVFGGAMIGNENTMLALIGGMVSAIGLMTFVCFAILIDSGLKR